MAKNNNYTFRLLNTNDKLDIIVRMHKTTFSNVISGQIGDDFLHYYYSLVLEKGFIFGCFQDKKLLGFVAGTINDKDLLSDKGLSKKALTGILKNLSPQIILSMLRHFKRGRKLRNVKINAELLSIITSEALRGKGIGKKLLNYFDNYLKSKGVKEYVVYTEINVSRGYMFYEKYAFSILVEMNLFGLKARLYKKQITQ